MSLSLFTLSNMANFIEYAAKAQGELNIELQKVADKEAVLAEQASLQAAAIIDIEKRQSAVAEAERMIDAKREELSIWDGKKVRSEEVEAMHGEAMRKDAEATKKLKEATDALIESRQNLEELTKRELALSEKEKTYREEVKKEIMDGFLGVK